MAIQVRITIVVNSLMKQFFILLLLLGLSSLIAQGNDHYVDRAPVELKKVSNLLKWSDFVVVAVKDELGNGMAVEEVILNKRTGIDLSGGIELGVSVQYEHTAPVVMRGYRYLFFLNALEITESEMGGKGGKEKVICKITGGVNGVVALFNQGELSDHKRVLWMKRVLPNHDPIKFWENQLIDNFGTNDGFQIKEAVEDVIAIYNTEESQAQVMLLVEGLRNGNPAMVRLCEELLISVELEPID